VQGSKENDMFDLSGLTTERAPGDEFSLPFKMALLDRRVRMPLEWLAESVRTETGERVSVEDLQRFAAYGWFPLTAGVERDAAGPGVYLYTHREWACTWDLSDSATPPRSCEERATGRGRVLA
jgi:hypothetical protein